MQVDRRQFERFALHRKLWAANPILYAKERLGINPTDQQARVLWAIKEPGSKVSVRAGHGVGKTSTIAICVYWMLETHDYAKIPCTAPSAAQLRDVLWAELSKVMRLSDRVSQVRGWDENLWLSRLMRLTQDRLVVEGEETQWFASARTARKEAPDALQGFHASNLTLSDDGTVIETMGDDSNLMFIVDEAPGVPDEVYMVAEGALSSHGSRLLMMGNPTKNVGYFADSHKINKAHYTTFRLSCADSPLADPEYRTRLVRQFGEGSNIVRVRADGEFPKQDDQALISIEWTEAALIRPRPMVDNDKVLLGVDVARFGDDRTVLVRRQGRHVQDIEIHAKKDTMESAGIVAQYCMRHHVDAIFVDANGVGAGVADRLRELKYPVTDVMVAEAAPERRPNREQADRIDMYPFKMRDWLYLEVMKWFRDEAPSFEGCPRDHADTVTGECVTLTYKFDSSGRLVVESKADMKRRGLRSPDGCDALALTFHPDRGSIWERL